jgi:hypothetical protein
MSFHRTIPAAGLLDGLGCRVLGLYTSASDGGVEPLVGPAPPADLLAAAASLAATKGEPRPGARRLAAGTAVRVPLPDGSAQLWWIETPDGKGLSTTLIKGLVSVSLGLVGTTKVPAPVATPEPVTRVLAALAELPRTSRHRRLRQTLDAIGQATGWTGIAAIQVKGGRGRRVTMLEARPGAKPPSLRIFADRLKRAGETFMAATPAGPAIPEASSGLAEAPLAFRPEAGDPGPDTALYCETHGLDGFAMALPAGDGIGLYAEGVIERPVLEAARQAAQLRFAPAKASLRPWLGRTALASAALALGAWLVLPAPFEIGAPAELRPAEAQVLVVPHEARLVELVVRVGEAVAEGDLIARFVSPTLEEAQARAALDQLLEGLSAQEALAAGDYARYQLADQRREIAALRAEQGARRLAELTLTAPATGRVADLVPRSELGALMPVGTVVAEVESGERLQAVLQLAASDGPHVRAGMTGSVVVRGLVDKSYPVRLIEDPLVQGREDGSSTLTVLAAIEADAGGELFKGLTGFARIEAGERPRGLALLRPLTEYIRLISWQYLGLRL